MKIICPSCKEGKTFFIGPAPQWSIFAGHKLDMQLQTALYKCGECSLYFKYPRPTKRQLDALYISGDPQYWEYRFMDRQDWQIAVRLINRNFSNGTILDIGCWRGEFLSNMKPGWKCCGTEINPFASKNAKDKGIEIIETNFDNLLSLPVKFNVVTAFNILEHTEDPSGFIAMMSQLASAHGFIIVSTGDTGSFTWKLSKGNYWYCAIPEHLSFVNIKWVHYVADKLNLQVEYLEKFCSSGKSVTAQFFLDSIKNITYLISPALFKKLKKIKQNYSFEKINNNIDRYPPHWGTSKDHFIVVLRKRPDQ